MLFFYKYPLHPRSKIIDAGSPIALATDFNPGTTPSGNMNFVVATACIKMKMTPEEAINAATLNGAYAMNLSNDYGSITEGKKANLIITKTHSIIPLFALCFWKYCIDKVMIHGELFHKKSNRTLEAF